MASTWESTDVVDRVIDRVIDALAQPAGALKKLIIEQYPQLDIDVQVSPLGADQMRSSSEPTVRTHRLPPSCGQPMRPTYTASN